MIQIMPFDSEKPNPDRFKWTVAVYERNQTPVISHFKTCGLAVEFALLIRETQFWRGFEEDILVGDSYGSAGCDPIVRALERRGVEYEM